MRCTSLTVLVLLATATTGAPLPRDLALRCRSPSLSREFVVGDDLLLPNEGAEVRVLLPPDAHVVWTSRPISEQELSVVVCASGPTCAAAADVSADGTLVVTSSCAATVHLRAPSDLSPAATGRSSRGATARRGAFIIDECTDNIDNDGDRLADTLDPGCANGLRLQESGEQRGRQAHAFAWTLGNASGSGDAYIETLKWTDAAGYTHTVIDQVDSSITFFPHANTGTNNTGLYLYAQSSGWDLSTFTQAAQDPQSHAVPGKQNTTLTETGDAIRTVVTSMGDDFITFLMSTSHVRLETTYRFTGDVGTMTVVAMVLGDAPRALYFPVNLGNLQVGPLKAGDDNHTGIWHLSQKWNGAIQRGFCQNKKAGPCPQNGSGWRGEPLWPLGSPDAQPIRGNEYPSLGSISPVSAVGDNSTVSVGLMAVGKEFWADQTTVAVDHYDLPRAPVGPLLQLWTKVQLMPGQAQNLTFAFSVAKSPTSWEVEDIKPVVGALMKPYQTFFHTAYGSTPTYCPRPSVAWEMATDRKQYNRSTKWYNNGSRMYDILMVDIMNKMLNDNQMNEYIVWAGCIQSSHLMNQGSCEFDANCDIFDPHTDAGCDTEAVFANITSALAKHGNSVGFFERPCNEIVQPNWKSATMICPNGASTSANDVIFKKGSCVNFDLMMQNDTLSPSPQFTRSLARIKHLTNLGMRSFYFDSFGCRGRIAYQQTLAKTFGKKLPLIVKEGHGDVDQLFVSQLPWFGVWGYEPDNSILSDLLVPAANHFISEMGPCEGVNLTQALMGTKTGSFMIGRSSVNLEECVNLHLAYKNYLFKMDQYGQKKGCPLYKPPTCNPVPQPCSGADTPPKNGGKGDCQSSLASGATCTSTCNAGYTCKSNTDPGNPCSVECYNGVLSRPRCIKTPSKTDDVDVPEYEEFEAVASHGAVAQSMHVEFGPSIIRHHQGQVGAMNITLDMFAEGSNTGTPYPVVLSALPDIGVEMWNGTQCLRFPSYEYSRLHHSVAWDAPTKTNSLQYGWGGFTVKHTRSGPLSMDMEIVITNDPKNKSDTSLLVPLCNIDLLPSEQPINTSNHRVAGGFGPCPGGWNDGCYPGSCPLNYPQAICMDWGNASAAWVQTSDANVTGFELSSDSCPTPGQAFYRPKFNQASGRRIEVGKSVTLAFSLRFGEGWNTVPKGSSGPLELIRSELEAFGKSHPYQNIDLHGGSMAALMGSDTIEGASNLCKSSSAADCPNPRGWNFLGCHGKKDQSPCNVTTPEGIAHFEAKTRDMFSGAVARCLKPALKCRAIMAWSIEGSEWGDITYSGSPDMLPVLAPEMDKIADEMFALITGAGIRAGVTLRPQIITPTPGWNASVPPNHAPWPYYQRKLLLPNSKQPDEDAIFANLHRKALYAITRWNCSVFYVDSTGFPLVSVWQRLRVAFPEIVFIPEQSGPLDFGSVTPLQNDWNGQPIGVNEYTKVIWPTAYNYQLMQVNVNKTKYPVHDWAVLAKAGDVFRVDGWYDSAHNGFIEDVLAAADKL